MWKLLLSLVVRPRPDSNTRRKPRSGADTTASRALILTSNLRRGRRWARVPYAFSAHPKEGRVAERRWKHTAGKKRGTDRGESRGIQRSVRGCFSLTLRSWSTEDIHDLKMNVFDLFHDVMAGWITLNLDLFTLHLFLPMQPVNLQFHENDKNLIVETARVKT